MIANLILPNVIAYNVEKFDIRLGETCKVEIETTESLKWFFNNDEVLSLVVNGSSASIKADKKGDCEIQLQQNGAIIKTLTVTVFDTQATSLNIQVSEPELK